MRLPGGKKAVVDIGKLHGYCLSAVHPHGRHKARVFASALGITQADSAFLRDRLLEAALARDAIPARADEYGSRYILDFEIVHASRRAMIRSGWIVRKGEDFPRLTTCYVLSG